MTQPKHIFHRLTLFTALAWGIITFISCTADQSEYEYHYPCRFTFNTLTHNASDLKACVNPLSSGLFCFVRKEAIKDIPHYVVSLYGKEEERNNPINTYEEKYPESILGANNGLVIGCSSLNNGELYAFDLCCKTCMEDAFYYKLMTWDKSGHNVKCSRCGRSYNLNNGGFEDTGKGGKLMRYHASFDGTVLRVNN